MEHSNQFLGTERIGKLMKKYAIPCIISLLVGALYNIVDQIFIANASYLGSYGNAANTVVFPLTVVALAIAVMVGDGCCAFVSISLGKNDRNTARKSVGNAIIMVIVSSLVLTAIYLLFSDQIIGDGVFLLFVCPQWFMAPKKECCRSLMTVSQHSLFSFSTITVPLFQNPRPGACTKDR